MVSGDTLKEVKYWDEDTQTFINIEMTIRDHVYFRLLQRIEGALKSGTHR